MARVDLEGRQRAWRGQFHYAIIVALVAAPARFPTIHPLAVVVMHPGTPLRFRGLQHALLGGEEFVRGVQRYGAKPRIGDVDVAPQ